MKNNAPIHVTMKNNGITLHLDYNKEPIFNFLLELLCKYKHTIV